MMIKLKYIATTLLLLNCTVSSMAIDEVDDSRILSFEQSVSPMITGRGSSLELSDAHYKHNENSLRWTWTEKGAQISIAQPIDYFHENPNPKETSVSSFVFWAYAKQPIKGDVRFEFRKDGKVCSWFDFNTDFEGWRAGWVAFERDMEGTPELGMDELVITANAESGELYLDHLILSTFLDVRHHTAGFQLPYVNKDTQSHWLILLKSWQNKLNIATESQVSKQQQEDIDIVSDRLIDLLKKGRTPLKLEGIRKAYNEYDLKVNPDGTICGKSIFFIRFAETYDAIVSPNNVKHRYGANKQLLNQLNDLMYNIAIVYNKTTDKAERKELADMYVMLTRHLLDQGFMAGSELGTLHHLGYSMRNFYTAPILMKEVLVEAGLDIKIQQAMEWFSGVGEVKLTPMIDGMDIDTFNTTLIGRIASILMLPESPFKVAYLKSFSRWINNGYKISEGLAACFKSDGTLLHHRKHYPAYAIGGFDGAAQAVWLLNKTAFKVSQESHEILKNALLNMRFYSNLKSFPLALSGRHPDGKGNLIPYQYSLLAMAGSPDGKSDIDVELAEAYIRLSPKNDSQSKAFIKSGFIAEDEPFGTRFYAYNTSMSHRRDNWLVTVAGHSRYLWAAEHYIGANYYGRYLCHGSIQVMSSGNPITAFASGFRQEGWDWSRIPGTTAAARPIKEMKANILNVDMFSGYEEMLMSDERFAGGVTHQLKNGLYSMKLHEHDKYNGSLRATKSVFMFDNRIVAVGTDIENNLKDRPASTTLFQNYIGDGFTPLLVNGDVVSSDSYSKVLTGSSVIVDNLNTAYFVSDGDDVTIKCGMQHSLHEESQKPTQNKFATAYITHGDVVKGGSYEYLMVVNADEKEIAKYGKKSPYKVLAANSKAHIVYDIPTKITAFALFEAGAVDHEIVKSTSIPSLVMISKNGKEMTISVNDPDLRLYEGENDELFDEQGKRIERSIYSRDWKDNASIESTIDITVSGKWEVVKGDTEYCSARISGKDTVLSFKCRESKTRDVSLIKLK